MPHRKIGDKGCGLAIPLPAARLWLASSPRASGRVLGIPGAAAHAGVSRCVVQRWADRGLLPSMRDAFGRTQILIDDLSKFVRERLPDMLADQPKRSRGNWRHTRVNDDPTASATLYGIHDPQDGQCIYVGFSKNYRARRQDHKCKLRRGVHNNRQLQSLRNKRGPLGFSVLATGMAALMLHAEVSTIAALRGEIGDRLCNATAGGEGCVGMSDSVRKRLSDISKAKWQEPEYRRRHAASCCKAA